MLEEAKDSNGVLYNQVGSNDKYLVTKLRSYNITIEKMDGYL